jgi:hypothetical protein
MSIVAIIAMVGAMLLAFAEPASAAPVDVSGCRAAMAPIKSNGSILGMYPSFPGSQSTYIAACQINSKLGDADSEPNSVAASFTIHDFPSAVWHNGSVRNVTVTSDPAGAGVSVTGCRGINVGGEPSDYVNSVVTGTNVPVRTHIASLSGCTAASNTGTITLNRVTTTVTGTLELENSKARSFTDATTAAASTTITSGGTANFTAADIGCSISGTKIPDGTTITAVASTTSATMSAAATGAQPVPQAITICGTEEVTTTRTTNSANYASTTSLTDTGAVSNRFSAEDVGLEVFATSVISNPCVITAFVSVTSVTVANATTGAGCLDGTAGEKVVTIGRPSPTAPADGDQLVHWGVQLDLSPGLVAGGDDCSDDTPEGFAIAGTYRNPGPGNFIGGAFATQPTGTKAVGQVVFDTSVVDFAMYILERRAPEHVPAVSHYDYVIPSAPTTIALCASATSPGLGLTQTIDASTSSITSLPTGTGRPGTAQVRHIRAGQSGLSDFTHATSETVGVTWSDGIGVMGELDFERLCLMPAAPYEVDFLCGP